MKVASYVRVSTSLQDPERQRAAIERHVDELDADEWDRYVDIDESGADTSREQFHELTEQVADGEYDVVVMSAISRLIRETATGAAFIDSAVETDTTIELLDDMIDSIEPDDDMAVFFAKQLVLLAEQEREQITKRIRAGVREAQRQGKWTGTPPTGFTTDDDGYLVVDIEEYLAIQDAIERVDGEESYRSVAKETRFPRSTLMDLHKTDEKRQLYLEQEAEDERVEQALEDAAV